MSKSELLRAPDRSPVERDAETVSDEQRRDGCDARRATSGERRDGSASGPTAETGTVLSLLSDDHTRAVLRALDDGPLAAGQLVERVDASRATVYRRLDALESAGLVEGRLSIGAEGHHRRRFRVVADRLRLRFGRDGVSVRVGPRS
ncbi:winged helix-turn-helix domain-containing protein [Halosimplex sp. TS25]|uniref:winged helix-turn-helix domain-containing protein n=1 Tax=Halosimplex rarum TaxID=3396619 RepID=UPI0039E91E5B